MRRSVPVLAATAGSLALLASFHTSGANSGVARAAAAPQSQPDTTAPPTDAPSTTLGPQTAPTTAAGATKIVDGPPVSNRYGEVQVRVTLRGHQIVDVQALTLPSDRSRSAEISRYAGPRLRAEALQAQSAQIDLISGASYTSDSYAQSLQGALDRAG